MGWGTAILDAGMSLVSNLFGSHSQKSTNKANLKAQREQQAWEERMSNSAIQRRVADITAAGGNPATAFVSGGEASTPSVAAARSEAFKPDFKTNFMGAAVNKAQIENIKADTLEKTASAKSKAVQAAIDEATFKQKLDFTANEFLERHEQRDLQTKIMRNLDANSAAELRRLEGTVESMIRMAKQQAEAGKLNLAALRNIATMGGIEANQMSPILKILSSIILEGMKD